MNSPTSTQSPSDQNWNQIWQELRRQKEETEQRRSNWDSRAVSFARHTKKSTYAKNFIASMKPDRNDTVLDIGCGPGTLAVPLSPLVRSITAIDISQSMISVLRESCSELDLQNVTAQKLSWQDDWDSAGIKIHDVVLASRSLNVEDLEAALIKMSAKARHRVYISSLVGDGPYDRRMFEAIGRPLHRGPDYQCIYNLLGQMGIQVDISFLSSDYRLKIYKDLDHAIQSVMWMFKGLAPHEEPLLREYFRRHFVKHSDGWTLSYQHIAKWALISWEK